ncbi:hypothetical protein V495_07134 [Pseudogymnoascus sp. VKM F-4514 (FW-929)]|nr:hypothetical protein V490_08877 [Pseudogymnoascus sp. VKM F-3557]KFY37520.1 hypothetical protein V495_07134 [Pseudogymnoascus sp. VKM F-4514 (FW-929)]KFY55015.1 hypothetical protein V497_07277 [Pseudogymnoascus sp. VKM F-4516 (FW-969)]
MLRIKAFVFRVLQSIFTLCDLHLSHPLPQRVSFTRTIPSSTGSTGSFDILFYTPSSYSQNPPKRHPILINFHGGGFSIGHARDDARWATAVINRTSAVVVSVNYRLAPEYPFPVGIEDCVSAVLWLWQHADEFNLDISRTAFSGFSAGGNLAYAVAIRLHEELAKMKAQQDVRIGQLVGLVVFYGSVDWRQSRAERDASNPNLIPVIPANLFKLFDESYLYPTPDMSSPLLSPGIAPSQLLKDALPDHLVMINCAGDQLLAENEVFKTRLRSLGKTVEGCIIEGVGHAWDKKPSFKRGNVKRDEAYELAIKGLEGVWGKGDGLVRRNS